MSFTKFPRFQKITTADASTYRRYFSLLREPCSDLSLDNALVWLDYCNDLEVSDLRGNLVIRFTNIFEDKHHSYSLIGEFQLQLTLDELFDYLHSQTRTKKLSYVSEQIVNKIKLLPHIAIDEDRDNRDYVYNVADLAGMQGKAYKNMRGRVNNFLSDNPDAQLILFNLKDEKVRKDIESRVTEWSKKEKFLKNDPERWELSAIHKHLELSPSLTTRAFGLYIHNKLACITIYHTPPQQEWLIANHIKYDYNIRGIYGYATYQLALIAKSNGIKWINFEQDLGKDGIRDSKMFFRPEKFLHRYTVSLEAGFKNQ